jgi:threonine/homoserine/homoserine lactone efflux protein
MAVLLASVLPLAVGAAISPTLLALQLLVLTGATRPVARAWAVVAGAALVLAAFAVLGITALDHLRPAEHHHHSLRGAVIMFLAGGLMAGLAVRSLLRRPTPAEQHKSRTAERLETAPTFWFVGVGALGMVVNFSTLVLFLPALHEITRSSAGNAGRAVVFGVLFVVTLLPVLAPVVLVAALGRRAEPALDTTHAFVNRHARQIGVVIEVIFAVYLVAKGVGELP